MNTQLAWLFGSHGQRETVVIRQTVVMKAHTVIEYLLDTKALS